VSYPVTIPFSPVEPVTGIVSPPNGALLHTPRVDLGVKFANAVYTFFLSGTSTPVDVYQNASLTVPFSPTGQVTADAYGRFPAIYLDPLTTYKVTLTYTGGNRTVDPYQPAMAATGNSAGGLGLRVNNQYEYTVASPNSGGSGVTLTLAAAASGGAALELVGDVPGTPLLIINNSATTGAQTAVFSATNRPGTATSAPVGWLPIQCDGTLYYAPLWFDNNFQRYIFIGTAIYGSAINAAGVAFNANGSYTLTGTGATATPSQWASPTQNGLGTNYWLNLTKTSGLAGATFTQSSGSVGTWTNIGTGLTITSPSGNSTVGGTFQLSSSSGGTPVVASGTISLTGTTGANSQNFNVGSIQFVTDGTITYQGGSAPGNWYLPTTGAIGSSYYLYMTTTGGTNGVTIGGISQSTYTALTSGLNIYATAVSASAATGYASGTYSISTSASAAGVVATGTWTIGNQTSCPQAQAAVSSSVFTCTFQTNGTISGGSSWYLPTTANIGSSYYVMVNNFTGSNYTYAGGMTQGTWYQLSSNQTFNTSRSGLGSWSINYNISATNGGPILAQGTISAIG
jgi:hypothetical protein